MFPWLTLNNQIPDGFLCNILDNRFYSASLKAKITGVSINDVPDKRTERPVPQTFQEHSSLTIINDIEKFYGYINLCVVIIMY